MMTPGSGFDVAVVEDGHFVARAQDGTTSWCLAAEPLHQHACRLVSRWHITPASAVWIALPTPVPSSWNGGCCSGSRPGQNMPRRREPPTARDWRVSVSMTR